MDNMKQYKRDALLGALGAFLMLVGEVAIAVADCTGALRYGTRIFHGAVFCA